MNRIFGSLTIAIVTTIAKANVLEFSEDALNNLRLTAEGPSTQATMVNSMTQVDLTLLRNRAENEAHFQANYLFNTPNEAGPSDPLPISGDYHRVALIEKYELHSRIFSFRMRVNGQRSEPQTLIFQVYFSEQGHQTLVLEIPVFQMPSHIQGVSNEEQLQKWAKRKRVGLKAPFNSDKLLAAQNGVRMRINFTWLEDLLAHQVSNPSVPIAPNEQPRFGSVKYITRPLLLPKYLLDSCLNAIEYANLQLVQCESEGSRVSGDAGGNSPSRDSILREE